MRRLAIVLACLVMSALAVPALSMASPRQQPPAPRQQSRFLNPNLVQAAQVPGVIHDVSATRVLYLDSSSGSPVMKVRDRGTGADTALPQVPNKQIAAGWLTPDGVLLRTSDRQLFEWTGGQRLTDLGRTGNHVVVKGSFAAYRGGSALYRKDFTTGQVVEVARDEEPTSFGVGDVDTNGDVVYFGVMIEPQWYLHTRAWINRYHNGQAEEIVGPTGWRRYSPVVDGTTVVYHKRESDCRYCGYRDHKIALHDGTREIDLTPLMPQEVAPGHHYDAAGGWVAFVQQQHGGGEVFGRQLWRRGSDGSVTKLAEVERRDVLSVVAVGGDGHVLYMVKPYEGPASLHLSAVGQPPVLLASDWGGWTSRYRTSGGNFAKRVDGRWHLAIGGTLYALSYAAPAELTVEVEGQGAVTVGPYGQTCRTTCILRYAAGAEITLSAAADENWRFEKWSGACSGTEACQLRLLQSATVRAHFFAPATSTTPASSLPRERHLSAQTPASIPLLTAWKSSSIHGDITAEELQVSVNGGGFAPVPLPEGTTSRTESRVVGTASYQFRARGIDAQGRPGDWATGTAFTVDTFQENTATYSSGWVRQHRSGAWGGTVMSTDQPSASATVTVTGHEVGIVGSASREHGKFDVYVDESWRETVHAWSWTPADRRILTNLAVGSGTHTIRIVRTSGQGRIDLDGVVVLR